MGQWCVVDVEPDYSPTVRFPLCPDNGQLVAQLSDRLVLQVKVNIDCSVFAGHPEAQVGADHSKLWESVPQAQHLSLVFTADDSMVESWPLMLAPGSEFGATLAALAARYPSVDVKFGHHLDPMGSSVARHLGALVGRSLHGQESRRSYVFSKCSPPPRSVRWVFAGLTSIERKSDLTGGVAALARASRASLESLVVGSTGTSVLYRLFMADGGRVPVVYPRLHTLSMTGGELYSMRALGQLPDAAFMPQLRRLHLGAAPEVSLVALLRGSWATLEYLHVNYSLQAVGRMEELRAAFSNMPTNLRHISMSEPIDSPSLKVSIDDAARCAFTMCPTTETVTIAGRSELHDNTWKCALDGLSLVNLTRLKAVWSTLDTADVVTILRAAPNLQGLTCRAVVVGSSLANIDKAMLPAHMHQNYYPLGKRFAELDVWSTDGASDGTSQVALLLGVMCPAFTFLNVAREYVIKCKNTMQAMASTAPYDAYRPKLGTMYVRKTKYSC
ncbi:hypothetical protein H4R19_003282 [Coemansia spiralis]|nr:hypothetical protein H4R19_003282 [Coemansia spiralis]